MDIKKAKNGKKASGISKEEGRQGTLFSWKTPEEDKGDSRTTPVQHVTKGIPFTIKL